MAKLENVSNANELQLEHKSLWLILFCARTQTDISQISIKF